MPPLFTYGFYAACLQGCVKKFGGLEDLPIIKNPYQKIKSYYVGGKILDIGAGSAKPIQNYLKVPVDRYFSFDNDVTGKFNYSAATDIPATEQFSLITANQFFEHLRIQESIDLICHVARHLEQNGYFISTVPNASHPVRQQSNVTHVTAWEYKALYMLYRYANLDVIEIARYGKRYPRGLGEKILARYINRIYRIDWCDSILIVGKK